MKNQDPKQQLKLKKHINDEAKLQTTLTLPLWDRKNINEREAASRLILDPF